MPTIHAVEKPIRDIFSNHYAFSIPVFQRPYSWGTEQSSTLFDDLNLAAAGFTPGVSKPDSVAPYFMGSIVVIKVDGTPEADVIDGQQRLTTIALLLSALRANFTDLQRQNTFSGLLLEKGDPLVGTHDRCRLTLRDRDHAFFEENVLRHPRLDQFTGLLTKELPEPQRRLAENCDKLLSRVRDLKPEQREALAAFLLQHTYVVVVSTANLDSAFRIFSVLNDRGLDLSVADILKSEVVGKISDNEQVAYVNKWESAEDALGSARFADLFSHIRMIHERKKLRTTVLQGFRAAVDLDRPKEFIDNHLLPLADASKCVLAANYECADKKIEAGVNQALRWLLRLGDRDWMPVALLIITKYEKAPGLILQHLTELERLSAVLWLLRFDENARIERHAQVLAAITSDTANAGVIPTLDVSADEKTRALAVLSGDIYNLSSKPKRTFILLRLDQALSSGEARYEFNSITVEHVLPQTPDEGSQWLTWWPDDAVRLAAVHRLGNLALLNRRQNSAAKNWEFQKKKEKYFQQKTGGSPFQITSQVLKETDWTPAVFSERQSVGVQKLTLVWRLA